MQNPLSQKTQTTQYSGKNTHTYSHTNDVFDYVWRGLQSGKFISEKWLVNQTEYHFWKVQLRDLTDKHLKAGLEQTSSFKGFLTWSEFRALCMDGYLRIREQERQAIPPTTAALSDMSSFGKGDRWNELSKVTTAMMLEDKDGPITKASKAGRLTRNNTRGKSASEIIEMCRGMA